MRAGVIASLDRIRAEIGADRALLDDGQLGGQGAGAQHGGESVALSATEKLPEIWPRAAGDRFADDGRGQHLVVEHDRERPADVLRVISAKRVAPALSKRKVTTGSCVFGSKLTRASDRRSPEISTRSRTG